MANFNPDSLVAIQDGDILGLYQVGTGYKLEFATLLQFVAYLQTKLSASSSAPVYSGSPSQFLKGDGSLDSTAYLSAITASLINAALGFTPYSASNPNNFIAFSSIVSAFNLVAGTPNNTDSLLTILGKLQSQLNGIVNGFNYQGTWNASTNTPTLNSGSGTKGYVYKVNVAGTTNLDGVNTWAVGDQVIFDGTTWDKIDGAKSEVSTFNGVYGDITFNAASIAALLGYTPYNGTANPSGFLTVITASQVIAAFAASLSPTFASSMSPNLAGVSNWYLSITANVTLTTPTGAVAGSTYIFKITNTGAFTVTWSGYKFPGGTIPTMTSGAGKIDIYTVFFDGTNYYVVSAQNFA